MARSDGPAAHGVSVAFLRPLADVLGRLGEDGRAFLDALGVAAELAPETFVAGARVDGALDEIAARRRDPSFALTLVHAAAARPLGMFGHMVWLSGTLRDALARATRLFAMVSRRTALDLEVNGAIATLRQQPHTHRGRILTEFPFASFAQRARVATSGAFALRSVRFAHAGESTAAYRELFGVPVVFGAQRDELELAADQLELPLASADAMTAAVLEERIAVLAATATVQGPFVERARRAIAELEGTVTLTALAQRLALGERTLRRRLEREGLTMRTLVDGVRLERARAMLAAGKLGQGDGVRPRVLRAERLQPRLQAVDRRGPARAQLTVSAVMPLAGPVIAGRPPRVSAPARCARSPCPSSSSSTPPVAAPPPRPNRHPPTPRRPRSRSRPSRRRRARVPRSSTAT